MGYKFFNCNTQRKWTFISVCTYMYNSCNYLCMEFPGCIVLFGYFLNDSTVFLDNPRILNPAISPKIKIWTAAIIINFIVKHHVLQTKQCRVLHENIKNYQYVSRMTGTTKLLKMCLWNILVDNEIFKR